MQHVTVRFVYCSWPGIVMSIAFQPFGMIYIVIHVWCVWGCIVFLTEINIGHTHCLNAFQPQEAMFFVCFICFCFLS